MFRPGFDPYWANGQPLLLSLLGRAIGLSSVRCCFDRQRGVASKILIYWWISSIDSLRARRTRDTSMRPIEEEVLVLFSVMIQAHACSGTS